MANYNTDTLAAHLQGMIRIPTVSHPDCADMDFDRFRELHAYLEATYPLLHKTLEKEVLGRGALLYRWKGADPAKEPLLMMAHQDVVPEGDHASWKYPPYSGEIAEGKVWGRGTTDSKCNILAHMEAIEALIAEGFTPSADIYLAYGYNEEVMGGPEPAAMHIVNALKERNIHIGMVIDECGGPSDGKGAGLDCPVCEIIVAEKGYADYEFSATNKGGHSCLPARTGALTLITTDLWLLSAEYAGVQMALLGAVAVLSVTIALVVGLVALVISIVVRLRNLVPGVRSAIEAFQAWWRSRGTRSDDNTPGD